MNSLLVFFTFLCQLTVFAQDVIPMSKSNGVYTVPCEVNDLKLNFIFDTGASDISISLSDALFMIKNGYLSENDLKGAAYYQIANGDIVEGTTVNIRKLKVGSKIIYNVEASIVHSISAPLLLGQSALRRFGKFTINYSNNTLVIGKGNKSEVKNTNNTDYNPVRYSSSFSSTEVKYLTVTTKLAFVYISLGSERFVHVLEEGDKVFVIETGKDFTKVKLPSSKAFGYIKNDALLLKK